MKRFFLGALAIILGLSSCKKYYEDTGVHNPVFNGNTLQFLEAQKYTENGRQKGLFDTTLMVIKLAEMESAFTNTAEKVTFFAPTSASISRSIIRLNRELQRNSRDTVSQLSQIDKEIWKRNLSMYIFRGSNLLKDYPQRDTVAFQSFPGQGYNSGLDANYSRIMNIGVNFQDVVTVSGGVETRIKYAGYRQLFLAYIPDLSNPLISLVNIPVATSDIQTNTGVIHVLNRPKHNFGFNTDRFIEEVIAAGIKPASP